MTKRDKTRFTLGVTGHRDLTCFDETALREKIRPLLAGFQQKGLDCRLMDSIAEGADQICAEEALALGYPLVCPLPFPDYRSDFSGEALARYDALLSRAEERIIIGDGRNREEGYWLAGKYIADNCDALLAVWDGKVQQSICGTASVVLYARQIGKRVIIIS